MKKILFLFSMILISIGLCSCGNSSGAPEGMQLVNGGEELGYYFYVPEEWTLSNLNGVDAAYVSMVDTTSVSLSKTDPTSFNKKDGAITDEVYFFEKYFEDSFDEFPEGAKLIYDESKGQAGEDMLFGAPEAAANRAKKYVVEYKYGENSFRFIQIFLSFEGRFYIMTYSGNIDVKNEGDTTAFEKHTDSLDEIINSFRFVKITEGEKKPESETVYDEDGYALISSNKLCGFDLFVPTTFAVDYASGIVSATHEDGSNVTMSKTTAQGMMIDDYYEMRKTELSAIVGEITEIEVIKLTSLGNSKNAAAFEYTYTYRGETFHVYQIFAVYGMSGYTFTYTAREALYESHFEEITSIIGKVKF